MSCEFKFVKFQNAIFGKSVLPPRKSMTAMMAPDMNSQEGDPEVNQAAFLDFLRQHYQQEGGEGAGLDEEVITKLTWNHNICFLIEITLV